MFSNGCMCLWTYTCNFEGKYRRMKYYVYVDLWVEIYMTSWLYIHMSYVELKEKISSMFKVVLWRSEEQLLYNSYML